MAKGVKNRGKKVRQRTDIRKNIRPRIFYADHLNRVLFFEKLSFLIEF